MKTAKGIRIVSCGLAAALLLSACGASAAKPKPLVHVVVAEAAFDSAYAPFLVALEKGYYRALGLDVSIVHFNGTLATPSLLAGKIGISMAAGAAMPSILSGSPLKEIFTAISKPPYWIVGRPGIDTLAQLRGKPVAIQGRGDTTQLAMEIYLRSQGYPDDAVVYIPLGFPGAQDIAAIQKGAVDAAVLPPSVFNNARVKSMIKQGRLHVIADLSKSVVMQYLGLVTSDAMLANHRSVVERFVQASLQGLLFTRDPSKASEVVKDLVSANKRFRTALTAPVLKANLAVYMPTFTTNGAMDTQAEKQNIAVLASTLKVHSVPVSQVYDNSLVQQAYRALQKSGWKP